MQGKEQPPANAIAWQPWSDSVFAQARREHKFVLLDLQAIWCHWCHVMDKNTYADPKVIALIKAHYIAVRVDQDSRPDLANRYEDYGWPATVVFNADRGEIVKRQGYLPPKEMISMLEAIVADPKPGPSVTSSQPPQLNGDIFQTDAGFQELKKQYLDGYDFKLGGWGYTHKFLDWDNVEYAMALGRDGDVKAITMAMQTLTAQMKLIDPVWGGVDQYSIDGWDQPHFEKLMQMQAEDLRIYAEAYAQWKEPAYLKAAQQIYGYVRAFLTSPDGVVYTSQDADVHPGEAPEPYFKLDDQARRKIGIPHIDTHIYARENGWFITALTAFYSATGDPHYRDEAVRAANWIIVHRSAPGGGFQHDTGTARLYLADTLAMGRAFLALYSATGDPAWLQRAETAAAFIQKHFAYTQNGAAIGFATAAKETARETFQPTPEFDENTALARFANLLFHYSNNPTDRASAETALRYAAAPEVARSRHAYVGGLLLAESELKSDPLHIVVIGGKADPLAQNLFTAALAYPGVYKQTEWHAPGDPAASSYPQLGKPAAYVCVHQACSSPVFDPDQLVKLLDRRQANVAPAK